MPASARIDQAMEAQAQAVALPPMVAQGAKPAQSINVVADWSPRVYTRHVPIMVRLNRVLKAALIACCGLAVLGYGLDVATSSELSKRQEQARRLTEQNTELSAQLLRAISFQGIQANVVGRSGLRVPERVIIVKEVKPLPVKPYQPRRHYLPVTSGY